MPREPLARARARARARSRSRSREVCDHLGRGRVVDTAVCERRPSTIAVSAHHHGRADHARDHPQHRERHPIQLLQLIDEHEARPLELRQREKRAHRHAARSSKANGGRACAKRMPLEMNQERALAGAVLADYLMASTGLGRTGKHARHLVRRFAEPGDRAGHEAPRREGVRGESS